MMMIPASRPLVVDSPLDVSLTVRRVSAEGLLTRRRRPRPSVVDWLVRARAGTRCGWTTRARRPTLDDRRPTADDFARPPRGVNHPLICRAVDLPSSHAPSALRHPRHPLPLCPQARSVGHHAGRRRLVLAVPVRVLWPLEHERGVLQAVDVLAKAAAAIIVLSSMVADGRAPPAALVAPIRQREGVLPLSGVGVWVGTTGSDRTQYSAALMCEWLSGLWV